MKTLAILGAAALLCGGASHAQSRAQNGRPAAKSQQNARATAIVSVSVSPEVVTVGQPFTVRVRVRAPKFATIHFPAVPDTADAIEAVDPRAMEDARDAEFMDRTAVYRLVAWDVGQRTPHFANVIVTSGGSDQQYALTLPPVSVRSLLPEDTAQHDPKGARDPIAPPSMLWKFVVLGALILAGLLWYWLNHRRHRARTTPPEPEAFTAAKGSFEALDALGLAAAGETGRHVIASVDVLRTYLARRFPEMRESLTSLELDRALPGSDLPVLPQRLSALLQRESVLRFARADVSTEEAVALGKESQAIVRDIQTAYEERVRAMERRPKGRRR